MVLGVKTKARKGTSIQLNYLIHIQEIKPWPPSHSLRSLRAAQIQWENGEKSTGSTKSVIPSTGNGVNEGKIEFNESFKLPVTLLRNMSAKAGDADVFQKNCLEFSLYEPRRDKTQKGQLLGTAIIDLADYGVIRDSLTITVQVHCQRNYKNTAQPLLYVTIQPVEKSRNGTSLRNSLSKEASLDKNGGESVLALMKEEYAEEAESNTFSDDDVSSDSSMAVSSDSSSGLPPKHEQKESNFATDKGRGDQGQNLTSETGIKDPDAIPSIASCDDAVVCSSCSSSIDLSYDLGSPEDGHASSSSSPRSSSISVHNAVAHSAHSSLSSLANGQRDEGPNAIVTTDQKSSSTDFTNVEMEEGGRVSVINGNCPNENGKTSDGKSSCYMGEQQHVGTDPVTRVLTDTTSEQGLQGIDLCSPCRSSLAPKDNTPPSERLRHVKSVRSTSDSARSNGTISSPLTDEVKESDFSGDSKVGSSLIRRNERKDAKFYARDTRSTLLEAKVQQMERKIQMLEGELREVAAVEVALYSVVAEHGSSMSKVHAPARRLSRLYLHACREHSLSRRASAARSAVSGLVLVSKACGNDVPRLMYWLSNCVVLRSTISQAMANTDLSISPIAQNVGIMKENARLSALKWESSPSEKRSKYSRTLDWEDPQTFISALEKVEAWIFSRTVESIWWQTLTPHMQCTKAKTIDKGTPASSKSNKRINHVDDQGQGNIAMDLWKKAFKDACERLCPVRAGGHECGCLPMLARLIMEQCVSRLDVAMFNAILRESADDIPTDPVSDPISDSRVLPIPAGKSSFGAGAQLKNVIGNWSRWLTDLFGMDDDLAEDENEIADDDDDDRQDSSFKSFHLLNALSDLMMLPKDMLLSKSIRKEVCPAFGVSLIQRVLNTFVPDEFCPDPIPGVVFEALESQDPLDDGVDSVTSYPYIASPLVYIPPLPSSVAGIIGEIGTQNQLQRSGSSVLRKSYTSDDELDELNSPLALILIDGSRSSPVTAKPGWISKDSGSPQHALRFDLLRDIWLNSE